jgi:peptidyl-prolyl cis-trans isomerase D
MLAFFRKALSSWFALALLGIMLLALAVTGVGTPTSLGELGGSSSSLATVAGEPIEGDGVSDILQLVLEQERTKNPALDMATLIKSGAADELINELIDQTAVKALGTDFAMAISQRLQDGMIASNKSFEDATGKFSETQYQLSLEGRNLTDAEYRKSLSLQKFQMHMLYPIATATGVPEGMATSFARLEMEERTAQVAMLDPSAFIVGQNMPTDAEVQDYYKKNAKRYTVPETRSMKYALFDRSIVAKAAVPSDDEINKAFQSNPKFAAREQRDLTQVILQDQNAAKALAAKVRSGAAMADAAKAASLDALPFKAAEKKDFAGKTSDAVANAAFTATKGSVIEPAKSGLGWHVVKVDNVNMVAAATLSTARDEIVKDLTKVKTEEAMGDFVDELDKLVTDGASYEEVAKAKGLTIEITPSITQSGYAPGQANYQLKPELVPVLKTLFTMDADDEPGVYQMGQDSFAFFGLGQITTAAPKPLAEIKTNVIKDILDERGSIAARKAGDALVTKINAGTDLKAALAAANVKASSIQELRKFRREIAPSEKGPVPQPFKAMFDLPLKRAKLIGSSDNKAWLIVYVSSITPAKGTLDPQQLLMLRQGLGQVFSQEYVAQYVNSARKRVGVTRNEAAIAAFKKNEIGQ